MKKYFLQKTDYENELITYENSYYTICKCNRSDGAKCVVTIPKEAYIPDICFRKDEETDKDKIVIETRKYSHLGREEIEKIIEGLQAALLTVEQLEDIYINSEGDK